MPRYHFHLADGRRDPDASGVFLPNLEAARIAAVQHAGELLKDCPGKLWNSGQWRVEVTDDRGVLLCTVIAFALDAPVPEQRVDPDVRWSVAQH